MSTRRKNEKVLCIRRTDLPPRWVSKVAVVKMVEEEFFDAMAEIPFYWLLRTEAETDAEYKQLIPYVLFQTTDGLYTGCYCRNGSEERLHDLCSVGVGGHINCGDCINGKSTLRALVKTGMKREMKEEFRFMPMDSEPVFHGVINEEKTVVGHVHLGLVYRVHVWQREGLEPGEELHGFGWVETDKAFQRPLELWSRLALNLLDLEWE